MSRKEKQGIWQTNQLRRTGFDSSASKWQQQVTIAEGYWADCGPEDRDEMRTELRQHAARLCLQVSASDMDDVTKNALQARLTALLKEISHAYA